MLLKYVIFILSMIALITANRWKPRKCFKFFLLCFSLWLSESESTQDDCSDYRILWETLPHFCRIRSECVGGFFLGKALNFRRYEVLVIIANFHWVIVQLYKCLKKYLKELKHSAINNFNNIGLLPIQHDHVNFNSFVRSRVHVIFNEFFFLSR